VVDGECCVTSSKQLTDKTIAFPHVAVNHEVLQRVFSCSLWTKTRDIYLVTCN